MILALIACVAPVEWTPLTAGATWPVEAPEPIPVPAELAAVAWLAEPSRWAWSGSPEDGRAASGSFGLGDGSTFGVVGLDAPHDTITGLIGGGYQLHGGFFPDLALRVTRDGEPLEATEERVQRPRGHQVVRTWASDGDTWWSTTDVLQSGAWVRHVTVGAGGGTDGLALQWQVGGGEAFPIQRGSHTLDATCAAMETPAIPPGGEWSTTCALAFDGADPGALTGERVVAALEAEAAATEAWLADGMSLTTPDPAVDDLYVGALLTMAAQTTPDGVVSPMNRYTKAWLRDTEGPARLYLEAGRYEDAAAAIHGVYRLAAGARAIKNSYELDAQVSDEPADWSTVPFMPDRAAAEAPSFPVILDGRVRRAWGAPAIDDEAFLAACVDRQAFSPEGLLPFSGDETYRYPMAPVVGALPEELGWSAGSSLLWIAAADALGRDTSTMRQLVADVYRDPAAGWLAPLAAYDSLAPFPAPYEDISLLPGWLGLDAAFPGAAGAALDRLTHPDGAVYSDATPMVTGMIAGYALSAARSVASPGPGSDADLWFDAIGATATPSGHFEETLGTADGRPLAVTHAVDGTGGDVSARFRPWETGIVVAALVEHLVGADPDASTRTLRLSPRLPAGWPALHAADLRLGDDRYDLDVVGFEEGIEVNVTRSGGADPWTVLVYGVPRPVPPGAAATWRITRDPGP